MVDLLQYNVSGFVYLDQTRKGRIENQHQIRCWRGKVHHQFGVSSSLLAKYIPLDLALNVKTKEGIAVGVFFARNPIASGVVRVVVEEHGQE